MLRPVLVTHLFRLLHPSNKRITEVSFEAEISLSYRQTYESGSPTHIFVCYLIINLEAKV